MNDFKRPKSLETAHHRTETESLDVSKEDRSTESVDTEVTPVPGFKFPLQNRLDVERLEIAIQNSKDFRKKYIHFLMQRKPKNMVIEKFITTIFSDDALISYNLNGSNTPGRPKRPMKAYSVFYDCFIEAFQSIGLNEHQLQSQLTTAIKHSRNRMRQRTFRARKHMEKQLMPSYKLE